MRIITILLVAVFSTGAELAQAFESCVEKFGCADKKVECESDCKTGECILLCHRESDECFDGATELCSRPQGRGDSGILRKPDEDRTDRKMIIIVPGR
jgi:hypothetical protein